LICLENDDKNYNAKEVLDICGLNVIKITTWNSFGNAAKYNDWKVVFICKKK
jgi:hypothetical protein